MSMQRLVGRCLMSTPQIEDPLFGQSVVLVYEQQDKGIAGLVLNKKGIHTTAEIARKHGYTLSGLPDPIYVGGPVNPNAIIMLHTTDWSSSNTMHINKDLAVSSDNLMMQRYLNGDQPKGLRFFSGCAVWTEPQLRNEMNNHYWMVSDLTVHQVFDYNAASQWQLALENAAKSAVDSYM